MYTDRFDKNNYEFNAENETGIYLIHGFSSSTYEMKSLAKFLDSKKFHVILNNLPGHGTTIEECNRVQFSDWLDATKKDLQPKEYPNLPENLKEIEQEISKLEGEVSQWNFKKSEE